MKEILKKLMAFENLTQEEAAEGMQEIMEGNATPAQIAAFVTALKMKGETIDEIIGCARVMRQKAAPIGLSKESMDIVGTGGDGANTFNISTCVAFVVSACGVPVAKHGNRAVSSRCGSADVLESLGIVINIPPEKAAICFEKTDICFMFAPVYHASMKHAAAPRKELGVRTIFNLLGPLSNPAHAAYELLGVYDEALVEPMAHALLGLGVKGALVVHSADGLDEISISAPTTACEVREGKVKKFVINPQEHGFKLENISDIQGGDVQENAHILSNVLDGEKSAKRNIILLNAGVALYVAGKADTISAGVAMAELAIDSGAAKDKLSAYRRATNQVAGG